MSDRHDELVFFIFKQKTAYEVRIRDWSSDVCSSDLIQLHLAGLLPVIIVMYYNIIRKADKPVQPPAKRELPRPPPGKIAEGTKVGEKCAAGYRPAAHSRHPSRALPPRHGRRMGRRSAEATLPAAA